MITSIILLVVTVIFMAEILAMNKRIKELETDVYCHMEGTHYPAIKNEFASVWREIKGDEDDDNC